MHRWRVTVGSESLPHSRHHRCEYSPAFRLHGRGSCKMSCLAPTACQFLRTVVRQTGGTRIVEPVDLVSPSVADNLRGLAMTGARPSEAIPIRFEAHFVAEFTECRVSAYRGGIH